NDDLVAALMQTDGPPHRSLLRASEGQPGEKDGDFHFLGVVSGNAHGGLPINSSCDHGKRPEGGQIRANSRKNTNKANPESIPASRSAWQEFACAGKFDCRIRRREL